MKLFLYIYIYIYIGIYTKLDEAAEVADQFRGYVLFPAKHQNMNNNNCEKLFVEIVNIV